MGTDQLIDDLRGVYHRAADRAPLINPEWSGTAIRVQRRPIFDRSRWLAIAAAVVLIVAATVGLVVTHLQHTDNSNRNGLVDLGSISQFPVGSITAIDNPGAYVVNNPTEGLIVLDRRSPHLGCRVVQRADVSDPSTATGDPEIAFIDPCHGSHFDLAGNNRSGPAVRGMYHYRVDTTNGRILVDTSLLIPGPWAAGYTGGTLQRQPSGVVDATALQWKAVLDTVAKQLPSGTVVELGTFHDPSSGVVTSEITYNSLDAELKIVQASSAGSAPISPSQFRQTINTSAGQIMVYGPPNDPTAINARLAQPDGASLQINVVAPVNESDPNTSLLPAPKQLADLLAAVSTANDAAASLPCDNTVCHGFDSLPVVAGADDYFVGPESLGVPAFNVELFEQTTRCAALTADFTACAKVEGDAGVNLVSYGIEPTDTSSTVPDPTGSTIQIGTTYTDITPVQYATLWEVSLTRSGGPQTPVTVRGHNGIRWDAAISPSVVWQERAGVLAWVVVPLRRDDQLLAIAESVRSFAGPPTIPSRVVVPSLGFPWDASDNSGDSAVIAVAHGNECFGFGDVDNCGQQITDRTFLVPNTTQGDLVVGSTPSDISQVRITTADGKTVVVPTKPFANYSSRFFNAPVNDKVATIDWLDSNGNPIAATDHPRTP